MNKIYFEIIIFVCFGDVSFHEIFHDPIVCIANSVKSAKLNIQREYIKK